jgi:hypothetical protein
VDAKVLLDYKGHVIQKYRTKTDKKGKFVHVNVYSGNYDVTVSKDGLGEAVFKNFTIRDLGSTEKAPLPTGEEDEWPPPTRRRWSRRPVPGRRAPTAAAAPPGRSGGALAADLKRPARP